MQELWRKGGLEEIELGPVEWLGLEETDRREEGKEEGKSINEAEVPRGDSATVGLAGAQVPAMTSESRLGLVTECVQKQAKASGVRVTGKEPL